MGLQLYLSFDILLGYIVADVHFASSNSTYCFTFTPSYLRLLWARFGTDVPPKKAQDGAQDSETFSIWFYTEPVT